MKRQDIEQTALSYYAGKSKKAEAVRLYASEIIGDLTDKQLNEAVETLKTRGAHAAEKVLMNGAESWMQYSTGGCSLVWNEDIEERLGKCKDPMQAQAKALSRGGVGAVVGAISELLLDEK